MFFTRKTTQFPTSWRTYFAWTPVQIGEHEDRKVYAVFERYEARWIDDSTVERRVPAFAQREITSCKVTPPVLWELLPYK